MPVIVQKPWETVIQKNILQSYARPVRGLLDKLSKTNTPWNESI